MTAFVSAGMNFVADEPPAGEGVVEPTLKCKYDSFNGVIIDHASLKSDPENFERELTDSLTHWETKKLRGIWLQLPIELAVLVPIAVKLGFKYHHAQPNYLQLTKWLPVGEKNTLPDYATHFIGVAGFVVNDKNELLVVQERISIVKDMWKLPGGAADVGEDLAVTAVREVFEETGIRAEFESVIGFRHMHNFRFGRSDLYFVCRLRPLSSEINFDPHEIGACQWMKLDDYINHPNTINMNKTVALSAARLGPELKAEAVNYRFGQRQGTYTMYLVPPENGSTWSEVAGPSREVTTIGREKASL